MINKKVLAALIGTGLLILLWAFLGRDTGDQTSIFVSPKTGDFHVTVTTSGELRAKNSIKIRGPQGAREIQLWNLTIQNLVPEGTIVSKGDFVAELDRSEILSRHQDAQLQMQRVESQYEQAQLDSSLTLSEARDRLENMHFQLEERQIAVEQSMYEPPSVQRQTQVEFDRTKRQLEQEKNNYETRVRQSIARLREIEADLTQEQNKLERIQSLMSGFTVLAPDNGMIVYNRNWRGQKTTSGSTISAFDPVVAELPDLSMMESLTYVNEVDIQAIRTGQPVELGLDAIRGKKLTGVVTAVGNIGEQRPNQNSKVFEVIIEINEADTTLLPAMTTSNEILIDKVEDALYVPLEAVHPFEDDHFVFRRDGLQTVMQQIIMGATNENDVVILEGLSAEDRVLISMPPDPADLRRIPLPDEVLDRYRPIADETSGT